MARHRLHIDIETYSSEDIKVCGNYKYVESPDFEILLIAYALDDQPVEIIDLAGSEEIPEPFVRMLKDKAIIKCAHNATFERIAFRAAGYETDISEWECSMVKSAYCGLPLSLDTVSKVLELGEKGKLATGKALITYFSKPCKPTKTKDRHRNLPEHDPEKWELFKQYCKNDVEAEREIDRILSCITIPEWERENYIIDQEINDYGALIDKEVMENAILLDNISTEATMRKMQTITGLDNPNSPIQLKSWLSGKLGEEIQDLTKDSVVKLRNESVGEVRDALDCRLKLAKTSTKKYVAMENCRCQDGRAHGLFQFYGANRTGRWSGRLIQLQNLPQNHMKELDLARNIVKSGDYNTLSMMFDSVPDVLSELIRTAIVAPEGYSFAVSDFSAIEARVLSWVAGEEWRLEVFRTHGKIYEASASMMFGIPMEQIKKGSELRQRGKTAELALGYQGGDGALAAMDREGRIPVEERPEIVLRWRKANPRIVQFWKDVERAALQVVKLGGRVRVGCLEFANSGGLMSIELPSKRKLYYQRPRIKQNRFGKEAVVFEGMDQVTNQWTDVDTYGGKLTENIVQAISRDLLAESMQKLRKNGFPMVMHVHDEVICEVPESESEEKLKLMEDIMGEEVPWAKGLPLVADGYVTPYYKKD